jgi:hypothetical protein
MKKTRFALYVLIAALVLGSLACSFSASTSGDTEEPKPVATKEAPKPVATKEEPAPVVVTGSDFIDQAYLSTDENGQDQATVFAADAVIYFIVVTKDAPSDTVLQAVWTAVKVEGEDPNLEINTTDTEVGINDTFVFNLSNDLLWPSGDYKVDLYVDGDLQRTLEFQVQ